MPGLPVPFLNPSVSILEWTGAKAASPGGQSSTFIVTTRLADDVTLTSGHFTDTSGNRYVMRVEGNLLIAEPDQTGWQAGQALVEFSFLERGIQRSDSFDLTVASALAPDQLSTHVNYQAGRRFRTKKFEFEFPSQLSVSKSVALEFASDVALEKQVQFSAESIVSAYRSVEFAFSSAREPADHWNLLLREDEEILMLA